MNRESEPQILFLAGVYLRECKTIDDIVLEKLVPDEKDVVAATPLPPAYIRGQWPTVMSADCPMCGVRADRTPITIITSIFKSGDEVRAHHNGLQFNLWTCAAAFIRAHLDNKFVYKDALTWFYRELEGTAFIGEISVGIPAWEVRECGIGHCSRGEWVRRNIEHLAMSQRQAVAVTEGRAVETPVLVHQEIDPSDIDDDNEFAL